MTDELKILGHRGIRHDPDVYENTLIAFTRAFDTADGVETDVVCSYDGVPYLIHDSVIRFIPHLISHASYDLQRHLHPTSREQAGKFRIGQMESAEIDKLFLKECDSIPRLSRLFKLASRYAVPKTINLELKAPRIAVDVVNAVDEAVSEGLIDRSQVIISSFDHDEMTQVQKLDPTMRTGLIFWQESIRPCRLYPWDQVSLSEAKPLSIENLEDEAIRRVLPDYFVLPVSGLTRKFVDAVKNDLYPRSSFVVWTAGHEPLPEKNQTLLEKLDDPVIRPHISAIITNHPAQMKRMLG